MALVEKLGEKLQREGGVEVETSSLPGSCKYVGLYFSAHWCPPCRMFTPELIKFYNNFREKNENKGKLEIVFVSSDQSKDEFENYFKDMPWLCLPFADRDRKKNLGATFRVEGIPTLLILDSETGDVVCADARGEVMDDPAGEGFPWKQ